MEKPRFPDRIDNFVDLGMVFEKATRIALIISFLPAKMGTL